MPDRYSGHAPGLESPAGHGFPITPDDGADLPETVRALYVGSGGSIALRLASGADLVLTGVAAGSILPLRAVRVKATQTSASALIGLV